MDRPARRATDGADVIDPLLAATLLGLALHLLAEPLMRRGQARAVSTGSSEHHTTALVSVLGVGPILAAVALRLLRVPLPGGLTATVAWGLVALLPMGATLRFWSMATLGEFFTRTLRMTSHQRLVESGPYRLLRHPGYLANLLVYPSAAALFAQSWVVGFVALTGLALGYAYRIGHEERMLVAALGDEYTAYQQRTWRLLPWLY